MPDDAPREDDDPESLTIEPSLADIADRLDNMWADERLGQQLSNLDVSQYEFSKYEIHDAVGQGAFGIVYRARDLQLDRDVALKIPRPEVLLDADRRDRFLNEAATAARLDHPAIVPVYEAELSGPTPYIASWFCPGPDLRQWIEQQQQPATAEDAARLIAALCDGVQYAHDNGVLHRDIKPGNILLEPCRAKRAAGKVAGPLSSYQPKLSDFGLAKLTETSLLDTRSSLVIGTPLYMAPEQLLSDADALAPATDVYALGVVLLELVTLKVPFQDDSYMQVLDRVRSGVPVNVEALGPNVPTNLRTICEKCLRKDASERYPTAVNLKDDLQRFLDGDPIVAKPLTWRDQLRRWCQQPQRISIAGGFSFWLQLGMICWVATILVLSLTLGLGPEVDVRSSLKDFMLVTTTLHGPFGFFAWKLRRRKLWAFWPSMFGNVAMLLIAIVSLTQNAVAFQYNYPDQLTKAQVFVPIGMLSLVAVVLHSVALPAVRRLRKST